MNSRHFIFEIGCEELPTSSLITVANSLKEQVSAQIKKARIDFSDVSLYYTPRRISLYINQLAEKQTAKTIKKQGPNVKLAFGKDGMPTLACLGFIKSCNASLDQLSQQETKKGTYVFCETVEMGKDTIELIPDIMTTAVSKLSLPKAMHWSNESILFLRPVHWICCVFGATPIIFNCLGKQSSNITYGHRFMAPKAIMLENAKNYETLLENAFVLVNPKKRKEKIQTEIQYKTEQIGSAVINDTLLNEVNQLVEWPVVLTSFFDRSFLSVPKEALMMSMESHQKCFTIVDKNKALLPFFVIVSNIKSKDPNAVKTGNRKVIHARLSDAEFFYKKDTQQALADYFPALEKSIYQKTLGSIADKVRRLEKIAPIVLAALNIDNTGHLERAAFLSKCDLMTGMVGEFPKLQGIMGGYYAKKSGEHDVVSKAISEQYLPAGRSDLLPQTTVGSQLSLIDRIETLLGIIGINKKPSGEKDPFALRRAAIGFIRIVLDKEYDFDLTKLLKKSVRVFGKSLLPNTQVVTDACTFIFDRLKSYYLEEGFSAHCFSAVTAVNHDSIYDIDLRIRALKCFINSPKAEELIKTNKRVSNILRKQDALTATKRITKSLLVHDSEQKLYQKIEFLKENMEAVLADKSYALALEQLTILNPLLDDFFNDVLVMDKDEKIQLNRLALLSALKALLACVADLSLL